MRDYIVIVTRDVLTNMQETYPDIDTSKGDSFEDELDIILQFMCGFESKYFFI